MWQTFCTILRPAPLNRRTLSGHGWHRSSSRSIPAQCSTSLPRSRRFSTCLTRLRLRALSRAYHRRRASSRRQPFRRSPPTMCPTHCPPERGHHTLLQPRQLCQRLRACRSQPLPAMLSRKHLAQSCRQQQSRQFRHMRPRCTRTRPRHKPCCSPRHRQFRMRPRCLLTDHPEPELSNRLPLSTHRSQQRHAPSSNE